jgi:hypothetical protein
MVHSNSPLGNSTSTVSHRRFSKHLPKQLLNYLHFSKIMALKPDIMKLVKCHQVEIKMVCY